MNLLFLDFETQGLDIETTNITEVGGVLWRLKGPIRDRHAHVRDYCYADYYPPQTEYNVELTGITDDKLKTFGRPPEDVLGENLFPLMEQADLILAHRSAFDKGVLYSVSKRLGLFPPEKPWMCTLSDIKWAPKYRCMILGHLAYDHGIMVPANKLHSAMEDSNLLASLVFKYDWNELYSYFQKPWILLEADCAKPWDDGGVQTGIAKQLGFNFGNIKFTDIEIPKKWVKRAKADEAEEIRMKINESASPFRVKEIPYV